MPAPKGNKNAKGNKGGRPTKYKEEYAEHAYKLSLLGMTDAEMADFFEISESTFNDWKKKVVEFSESIKKGKDIADGNVSQSLYKRAMGYEHKETKLFNNQGEIIREDIIKHYPPDTQAASLWLRNRQPKKWRDKQNIELTGAEGGPIKIDSISDEDLQERINKLKSVVDGGK